MSKAFSVPSDISVLKIRKKLLMSREKFSSVFGFSIRSLEKWEQGVRKPTGPTRAYLYVISQNPNAVREALQTGD